MSPNIKFTNPEFTNLGKYIAGSAQRKLPMVMRDSGKDTPGAIVCGSAPSLIKPHILSKIRKHAAKGWKIIACKEAIELLRKRKVPVHYSVSMDPTDSQHLKTYIDDGITYLIASSCHPTLFDHVLNGGRPVLVFHSACGWNGNLRRPGTDEVVHLTETDLYKNLFPVADVMCGGFTVVNRALSVAKYMGYPKVILAGADFGYRAGADYYAKGAKQKAGNEGIELSDEGRVDGKEWLTRPDLLASAVTVAKQKKQGHVYQIWGDSLANSLAKRDDQFLDECCKINRPDKPGQQGIDIGMRKPVEKEQPKVLFNAPPMVKAASFLKPAPAASVNLSVLSKVSEADIVWEPWPHIIIKDALSPEVYKTLANSRLPWPRIVELSGRTPEDNARFDVSAVKLFNTEASEAWKQFAAYNTSEDFWAEIVRVFGGVIKKLHPDFQVNEQVGIRWADKTPIRLDLQMSVNSPCPTEARVRGPHIDNPVSIFAGLMYMGDAAGGDLLLQKWKGERVYLEARNGHEIPDEAVETVLRVPYAHNTFIGFINGPDAVHAVTSRKSPLPRLLCNWVVDSGHGYIFNKLGGPLV